MKQKLSCLNLGCGKDIKISTELREWINLDALKLPGVEVVHDLEKPLPFEDNYFEEVFASHVLEHINNFMGLMEELYRVCKNGAIIKIICPYFASVSAFQDPTHIRFFTLKNFDYFLPDNYNNFITKARFKIIKKKIKLTRKNWIINIPIEFIINHIQWIYERFFCFILPFQEVEYDLEISK